MFIKLSQNRLFTSKNYCAFFKHVQVKEAELNALSSDTRKNRSKNV